MGPVIGGLLQPVQVGWLATGGLIASSIWTLLFVQESLDRKTRLEVRLFSVLQTLGRCERVSGCDVGLVCMAALQVTRLQLYGSLYVLIMACFL